MLEAVDACGICGKRIDRAARPQTTDESYQGRWRPPDAQAAGVGGCAPALSSPLPRAQLSRERRRLVGQAACEHEVLRAHRIVGLADESLRGVVLRFRVSVQQPVVDA